MCFSLLIGAASRLPPRRFAVSTRPTGSAPSTRVYSPQPSANHNNDNNLRRLTTRDQGGGAQRHRKTRTPPAPDPADHSAFTPVMKGVSGRAGPGPSHARLQSGELVPAATSDRSHVPGKGLHSPYPPFTSGGKPTFGACPIPTSEAIHPLLVPVYSSLHQAQPDNVMGFARGGLVADSDVYGHWFFADGSCPMDWRRGSSTTPRR